MKTGIFTALVLMLGLVQSVHAKGFSVAGAREDTFMISNGQGIASPSFFGSLKGENPAGLANNQTLKLQVNAAAMDDSTSTIRESGGLLWGNGNLGLGAEYSQFDSGAYASGVARINWGAAGNLDAIRTIFGISGHTYTQGGGSSYDFGLFFEPYNRIRFGAILPDFTHGISVVGAGLNFMFDPMVDVVVDFATDVKNSIGMVKPGLTLHTDHIHFSAAYGYRYSGAVDSYLYSKFTAGLGIKIAESMLLEYQYRNLPQHMVGLTLRM